MAEGSVLVPNTAGGFPVDGIGVTAPAALAGGQAIRQAATIGDGGGAANFAKVDTNGNQLIIATPIGGAFVALPAGPYTNGVAVTSGIIGVEITALSGGTVSYTIAVAQPVAAPVSFRIVQSGATDQINVNAANVVYITAITGAGGFYRSI